MWKGAVEDSYRFIIIQIALSVDFFQSLDNTDIITWKISIDTIENIDIFV